MRELPTGLTLGLILGIIGFTRIEVWQRLHLFNYGQYHMLVALTVGQRPHVVLGGWRTGGHGIVHDHCARRSAWTGTLPDVGTF